jgi:hypothetical protein
VKHRLAAVSLLMLSPGCGGPPRVPEHPTWADVEPIVRAECTHCHGPTARETGSSGALVYRFDFYDMTPSTCGDAAAALAPQGMALGWALLIRSAVEPPASGGRARMPPAPAPSLATWERETLLRWAADPRRGVPQPGNARPDIQLDAPSGIADTGLSFSAAIEDPDGEPVVGVLNIGDVALLMDRPGVFAADLDTRTWPAGRYPISASLCDGWDVVSYQLGNVQIMHK